MADDATTVNEQDDADVGRYLLLFGLLVVSILVLGLFGPGTTGSDSSKVTNIIITALSGGVLIAALRISGAKESHQRFYFITVITVIALLIGIVVFGAESIVMDWFGPVWVMLVVATPFIVLRRVIMAGDVTSQTIIGAVCVFLLIGISTTSTSRS
jgi:peptidoglycan/LPS O-acetylase OafA/YrhL